jgi:hypothetical protein
VGRTVLAGYWRTWVRWVLAVIGFVSTVRSFDDGLADDPTRVLSWTVPTSVLSLFLFWDGLRSFVKEWRRYREEPQSRQTWDYLGPYRTWPRLGDGPTHAIYSPELNRRLAADEDIRTRLGEDWKPEGRAAEHHERVSKRTLNEAKYRLASDLLEDSTSVELQRTDYAAFRVTNRLAYAGWWDRVHNADALTFQDVEPSIRDGSLPTLALSRSSNHIGGDILAIGEGFLFLQLQNNANGMYPGRWVGSASGSFDIADRDGDRLQDLVKNGLLRELSEEMSLNPSEVPTLADTKVVGYSRATYLGGKPQFYGVCRIARVTPGRDRFVERFERLDFERTADGVIGALDGFAAAHADALSPPLEMLVHVVREWLQSNEDATDWLWPRSIPGTASA